MRNASTAAVRRARPMALLRGGFAALVFAVAALVITAPAVVLAQAAQAARPSGLGVQGTLAEYSVAPGQRLTHKMVVSLGAGVAAPVDVRVESRGLGQALDGTPVALTADQDTSPYSARPYVQGIDKPAFRLVPGGSQEVTATIAVPPDVSAGSRYADLYIHTVPSGSGAVGVVLATHVPVVLKVAAAAVTEAASITALEVGAPVTGRPIEVTTVVQNTGNHHLRAQNEVTISDGAGNAVATQVVAFSGTSIVPTFPRQFKASLGLLDKLGGIDAGTYYAESKVTLPDGRVLDSQRTAFRVAAPYRPFPDLDEASLVVLALNDEEPRPLDARGKADVELAFSQVGRVSGTVVVGKYTQEPPGSTPFAAPAAAGGTGKEGVKFIGAGVQGFSQGTAQLTVHYRAAELKGLDPNSLFLAYRDGERWVKLDNLAVFTGAQTVRGDLAVLVLNRNPVIAIGGEPKTATLGLLDQLAPYGALIAALVVAALVGPTAVALWAVRRRTRA